MRWLSCPRVCVAAVLLFVQTALSGDGAGPLPAGPYLGQKPPGEIPVLFAPGVIPTEGIQHCFPAFSPDGLEVYWMRINMDSGRPRGEIYFMEEVEGSWTEPALAPFSGVHNDQAPVFSRDGRRLYFSSSRPGGPARRKNLWYIEKSDTGWSEPMVLGSPPNTDLGASQATFTETGSVYFVGHHDSTQWKSAIYRSRLVEKEYQEPELLGAPILTAHADVYPYIAPDESYLLFGSTRPGGNSTETDLYISFRGPDDSWGEPLQLDESINNGQTVSFPFVTHDGKYLFFTRFDEDGTDKFFWVEASILEKYRPSTGSG